jgi:hypothetical protein
MSKNLIETIGTISKEELLETVDYLIIPNSLVLETTLPFPGYHHHLHIQTAPSSIFIVTNKQYEFDEILRAKQSIDKYAKFNFDASAAKMEIGNEIYNAIRILDIDSFEQISTIQDYFRNEGFVFRKARKIKSMGLIHIRKFFNLSEIDEGIYIDNYDNTKAYFTLAKFLSWRLFERITHSVKNNWDYKDFDAAIGSFLLKGKIIDIVRVYQEKIELERIPQIIERYNSEINRIE